MYTEKTRISEVMSDPVFGGAGRLLFPANSGFWSGTTLGDLRLTWYTDIHPETTVEICNFLRTQAADGRKIFYDIYSEAEKRADPRKRDTGLYFFRGKPGAKFAICNAGGGFCFVGAMQDSFPHALTLAKKGYNAFALIYRPGGQTACEDLARAIAFVFDHAEELQVDVNGYSLWGGSAGARMAAWLGSFGTASFGVVQGAHSGLRKDAQRVVRGRNSSGAGVAGTTGAGAAYPQPGVSYPRPGAVIMQYTGLNEVYGNEPPTYNCVGTRDGIASYRVMERRIREIQRNGTDAEIEVFPGLSHGFGLGLGTVAEGWIDRAVEFWERNV